MKRLLLFMVMMVMGSLLAIGQQLQPKPILFNGVEQNNYQSLDQYFAKNVEQTRAVIWSSNMSTSTGWTVANEASTLSTQWVWAMDTAHASTYFKQYVGPSTYMKSPTAAQGVFYFDGITNLINSI